MARRAKVWIVTEWGLDPGLLGDDRSVPVARRSRFGGPLVYNPPQARL